MQVSSLAACLKNVKVFPSDVYCSLKNLYLLFCRLCSTIALDLQQKLAFPAFFYKTNGIAIFSWNLYLIPVVQKFSSLNFRDF